ncbi:MAG: phosphodiester glycosidase family protein [bacterium]
MKINYWSKTLLVLAALILLGPACRAATLEKVRLTYHPDKIRAVFDFDEPFSYNSDENKQQITIFLKNVNASSAIKNYIELDDVVVRYFEVERQDSDLKISIPLLEPVDYHVFSLNDPPRLVVDFGRKFTSIVSGGLVADGIELINIKKGTENGPIFANALKIDLSKAEVEPVLARKQKPSFLESFVDLIVPWKIRSGPNQNFYLDKVVNMVNDHNAVAGINGTYFANTGSPLGALIIDQELVSYPIYDRTAFFVDENNRPYIDNVYVTSYFELENNTRYDFSGINRQRGQNEIILYSPAWGEQTRTNEDGLELVIANARVRAINPANSKVPPDGYVISVSGQAANSLANKIKVGSRINTQIKLVPFDTAPNKIIHLVSGGPRLIKKGLVYISKNEENFQKDIARGRAARTAVGITKDNQLLLVTVDGLARDRDRSSGENSIGVTLEELSSLLLSLGAIEGMNLDGGSSSTMVVGGRTINNPTAGYQRRVSNALVIRPKL